MEHTVYRLRYETDYYIKYQSVNSVGPSGYSATITNQTLAKTLPSAPTDVVMIDLTGGAITLEWDEPLDIAGRDITGYTIKIVSTNGSVANVVGYDGKGNPSRNGTLYDLTADTQYGMQVVAYIDVSNCLDTKLQAWSAVINVTTQSPTLPRTSPELVVGGYTGGIIQLVWVAPKDKGGVPLTRYTLNLLNGAGVSTVIFSTSDTSVLSYTHNDLTANTKYSYTITTSNAAGVSPTSAVLEASTDSITAPSAPSKVRQLTYNTGGAVSIGWDRSFDTGGQTIAGYMVYRFGELVSGVLPSTARTFTNKDQLQASTSYNFTVRSMGLNEMPSMASDQLVATTTAATKPQKALSLSANPGSSYLNLAWIPSGDTGGVPIKAYEVKLLLDSTLVNKTNVTTTNVLLTGLTANTVYIGSVRVYNDVGSSEEISTSMITTTKGVPDAPKPPSIRGKFGGNFTIQLEPPLFTGGSAITVMKVYKFSLENRVTPWLAQPLMLLVKDHKVLGLLSKRCH
ncbi:hypothetical protein PF005_g3273 [Phytophthora fragariae]|uniref:Fibronectin type-III domain-containing protein n=2 Tax=Phytophthora fragariae TaxID=53985 RepID=A0A6A3ZA84_9STRA|nr:hypothetical protein PF010_g2883 [Phytophthora fragariae]KAE9230972.1 hypothetical protein PF005_g3273 [Phytophthora fragariae]